MAVLEKKMKKDEKKDYPDDLDGLEFIGAVHESGVSEADFIICNKYLSLYKRWRKLTKLGHAKVCPDWLARAPKRRLYSQEHILPCGWLNFARWSVTNGYYPGRRLMRIIKEAGWHPENCVWVDDAEREVLMKLIERGRHPTSLDDYDLRDDTKARKLVKNGMPIEVVARALCLPVKRVSIFHIKKGLRRIENNSKRVLNLIENMIHSDKVAEPQTDA